MADTVLADFALGFLGACGAGLVYLAARKLQGALQEARRKQEEDAEEIEPTEAERLWTAMEDAVKRLEAVEGRQNQLALRLADLTVEILDKAEKVAARLKDRERKRATVAEEVPAEDHDEAPDDPGQLLARARAAFPLPQIPLPFGGN